MNTTYHDRNHSRLGDIVDGIKLTKVHYLALLLVVTGGLFEVMEQLILASLGPSLQEAFGASASLTARVDVRFSPSVSASTLSDPSSQLSR